MTIEDMLQAALVVASVGLAAFCLLLARRLRRLNDLESGLGGAIAVMAAEVDRLEKAIRAARAEATEASESLADEIAHARKERALWDLRQRIGEAAMPEPRQTTPRRLRKRPEAADA
ncbi:hypothetical protein [Paracoccus salsus]|uniref:hypothetical protein n=1 Tax=Paracoccus salsus TaxID=2911061 RepID=UPI001F3BA153|nr:hypothetical protein [Paracoccus salsus]MCF3972684.1 hypothetical protein [Paracoccus salsus]